MTMIHLSIPIREVEQSAHFYAQVMGCRVTRQQVDRLDVDFFGHHLVCQLSEPEAAHQSVLIGRAPAYPLRHFGVIVEPPVYDRLLNALRHAKARFAMEPTRIFVDSAREQSVFIVFDPSGNALEVKGLPDPQGVFS